MTQQRIEEEYLIKNLPQSLSKRHDQKTLLHEDKMKQRH
jgi:hypothetical protein